MMSEKRVPDFFVELDLFLIATPKDDQKQHFLCPASIGIPGRNPMEYVETLELRLSLV